MASQSLVKFGVQAERAKLLATHAGKLRKKSDESAKLIFLHASLAAQVAAWDAYIKSVSLEYFAKSADPSAIRYSAVHSLLQDRALQALKKLNTPNSDNCRVFLLNHTGFDPWPAWIGIRFGKSLLTNVLMVRTRLDEIFSVRHSFAHGLTMPTYSWNTNPSGSAHLTCDALASTQNFFSALCQKTDTAYAAYIHSQHGIPVPW